MSSEHPYRVPYRVEIYGKDFLRPRGYQVVSNRTGEVKDRFPFDYSDPESVRASKYQAEVGAGLISTSTTWRVPANYTTAQIVYAIRHAKSHPHDFYAVPDGGKLSAEQYLKWFRKCLHKKINRERVRYGRKDGGDGYWSDYERAAYQTARLVNTPRLIVRKGEVHWEFRDRLQHRIHHND